MALSLTLINIGDRLLLTTNYSCLAHRRSPPIAQHTSPFMCIARMPAAHDP